MRENTLGSIFSSIGMLCEPGHNAYRYMAVSVAVCAPPIFLLISVKCSCTTAPNSCKPTIFQ